MANDINDQIKQARSQIEQARGQVAIARSQPLLTSERSIRQSGGLQGMQQRSAISGQIRQYSQNISAQEARTEQEIARVAPEQGRPEYVQKAYDEAIGKIKPQVENLNSRIDAKQEAINKYQEVLNTRRTVTKGDRETLDNMKNDLDVITARRDALKGSISGDKVSTIKEVLSGNAEARADYAEAQVGARIERQQAIRDYKTQLQKELIKPSEITTSNINQYILQNPNQFSASIVKSAQSGQYLPTEEVTTSTPLTQTTTITRTQMQPIAGLMSKDMVIKDGSKVNAVGMAGIIDAIGRTPVNRIDGAIYPGDKIELAINKETGKPSGTLTATEVPTMSKNGILERWQYNLARAGSKEEYGSLTGKTSIKTGIVSGLAGIGSILISPVILSKSLLTKPVETTKALISTGKETFKKAFVTGEGFPEISNNILYKPAYTLGQVAGNVFLAKGGPSYIIGKVNKLDYLYQKYSPLAKQPQQLLPTTELVKAVEPFSRQRATLILKDEAGNYILGTKSSGESISYGGLIEKGQTPRTAILAELGQETGLKLTDLKNFKYERKFVTPEETFHTYSAIVKDITKIKPRSDVPLQPRIVKPSEVKDITGMSALKPTSVKGIRSYEAGIINYLETGKEPTWLVAKSKTGTFVLGTQSRYNVPGSQQIKFWDTKEPISLTHATPKGTIPKSELSPFQRSMSIKPGIRGPAKEGLEISPPITSIKTFPRVTKLDKYSGVGKELSPKEIIGLPTKVEKVGAPGYLPVSYLGLDATQSSSGGLGWKIGSPKPTVFTFKQAPSSLSKNVKTLSGAEVEGTFKIPGIIRTTGPGENQWLGGKPVIYQPVEYIPTTIKQSSLINKLIEKIQTDIPKSEKIKILKQLQKETGIDYSELAGGYKYITKGELGIKTYEYSRNANKQNKQSYNIFKTNKESNIIPNIKEEPKVLFPEQPEPMPYGPTVTSTPYTPPIKPYEPPIVPNYPKIYYPFPRYTSGNITYNPYIYKENIKLYPPAKSNFPQEEKRKKLYAKKKQKLYFAEIGSRGKYKRVSGLVPLAQAELLGKRSAYSFLGRSVRVREAYTGKIAPISADKYFRPSKRIFGIAIQRNPLATRKEVRLIQEARRAKKNIMGLTNKKSRSKNIIW